MTISAKSDLITKVYKWLIRDQTTETFITQELVETYIQFCEAELNRELKTVDLEQSQDVTLSTSVNYVTLPSDYRGISSFEFDSRPFDIEYFSSRREMKERFSSDAGRPKGYIIQGAKIIFNCIPDSAYEMTLDYYGEIDALDADSDTNTILQKHPDVYLYGTIRQALININNKNRLEAIAPLYQNILERIKEDDKSSRMPSGGKMVAKNVIGG